MTTPSLTGAYGTCYWCGSLPAGTRLYGVEGAKFHAVPGRIDRDSDGSPIYQEPPEACGPVSQRSDEAASS